jgi:hypothetical protein
MVAIIFKEMKYVQQMEEFTKEKVSRKESMFLEESLK